MKFFSFDTLTKPPEYLPRWFVYLNYAALSPLILSPYILILSIFAYLLSVRRDTQVRTTLILVLINSYSIVIVVLVLAIFKLAQRNFVIAASAQIIMIVAEAYGIYILLWKVLK